MKALAVFTLLALAGINKASAATNRARSRGAANPEQWSFSMTWQKNGVLKSESWKSTITSPHAGNPMISHSVDGKTVSNTELEPTQDLVLYERIFELIARNEKKYRLRSTGCPEFMQARIRSDRTKICLPDAHRASEFKAIMATLRGMQPG